MSKDVEMKDAEGEGGKNEEVKKSPELVKYEANMATVEDIKTNLKLVERTLSSAEDRFLTRVLRTIPSLRKRLNDTVLHRAIDLHLAPAAPADRDALSAFLEPADPVPKDAPAEPEAAAAAAVTAAAPADAAAASATPAKPSAEGRLYLHLLVLIRLLDAGKLTKALACSQRALAELHALPRGVRDGLASKLYFYHARAAEVNGQLADARPTLLAALRSATLRRQEESQATLVNLLLRNYLHFNMYDQADKLVSKSAFPESASNGEWARHLYYLARIRAIQLDYSEALRHVQQAIRKAPSAAAAAAGFSQTAHKLMVIVQLLLGEIPDRSTFRVRMLASALQPYFLLTQAVRVGDVKLFAEVLEQHGERFQRDRLYTLILRVRHNVIKTGVRMINLSYSRISLDDVAQKLHLDSAEDAEFIVAKAARDGVVDAVIDRESGFVRSKEVADVYSTNEPQTAFHNRISFCLNIHNSSVKAMRYPPDAHRKGLESAEERREREQMEKELAQEIADDDEDY